MIDLRCKDLPQAIEVDGKSFLIKTDFRDWITIADLFNKNSTLDKFTFIFKNNIPATSDFIQPLQQFLLNPNCTPKNDSASNDRLLDYVLDGEYIYSAFMQAYNIDLIDIDYMHWHKFKALVLGLPDDTMLKCIMGYRGWRRDTTSYDTACRRNRDAWKLPDNTIERDAELLNDINKLFYNC